MATTNPKRRPNGSVRKLKAEGVRDRRADADRRKGEAMAIMEADPFIKVAEVAKRTGMSAAMINGIRSQMKRELLAPTIELRKVSQKYLLELSEDRLVRTVEAMDDNALAGAGLRDKAYAADRLFNMRQLMRGEPTQILSVDDRRTLNQLVPALLKEAQRRGVTYDGATGEVVPA